MQGEQNTDQPEKFPDIEEGEVLYYPPQALAGDFLMAGFGVVVMVLLVVLSPKFSWLSFIFMGLAAVFLIFLIALSGKLFTRFILGEKGITCKGLHILAPFKTRFIAWQDIEDIKLRYFGTTRQRKRGKGYMRLSVYGKQRRLFFIESDLTGFTNLTQRLAGLVIRKKGEVDPYSEENLANLEQFGSRKEI